LKNLQCVVKDQHAKTAKRGNIKQDVLTTSWRRTIESLKPSRDGVNTGSLRESPSDAESLTELRKWKAEVDSWDLLDAVTSLHGEKLRKSASRSGPVDSPFKIYQNSPNDDLWGQFILEEDTARERKVVLEWLEKTAQTSETSFESIVEQMESRTGTGSGTWSHGWLYTREKIKGEKRLGAATSLRQSTIKASTTTDTLVTELDPDAPNRQRRALEKQDQHYERSLWLACYEMVRRGLPWDEVRDWFEARNETWRAASLGAAQDLTRKQSRLCLGGPYGGALWRRMCFEAAQQTSADKYERAVYGLLAGDTKSVEPVCTSWQDVVYMNYNSLLLGSFETWLQKNHPARLPSGLTQKFPLYKPLMDDEDYRAQIMNNVLERPQYSEETNKPINFIQAVLISSTFEGLIEDVGRAIAARASESTPDPANHEVVRIRSYEDFTLDWNVLRILVHMIIVFRETGLVLEDHFAVYVRDIMVAYIDVLRLMGKIDAIPTYAVFLPESYRNGVMGSIFFDVTNHSEQEQLIKMMGDAKLNVKDILSGQYIHAMDRLGLSPGMGSSIKRFEIVEPASDRWAGWRVREGLKMPENDDFLSFITDDESRAVRALQWFFRCNSTWRQTFFGMSYVMKQFLRMGTQSSPDFAH
jgi:nuclear pore complex protein Nup107